MSSLPKRLYDYDEAAVILRVSPEYLQKHKRQLFRTEIGRSVSFCEDDLADNITAHRVRPEIEAAPAAAPQQLPAALIDLKPRGAERRSG